MDKLEKVFDNFVESVGKQYNLPKEAVALIQGGFAKYTAMCESVNPLDNPLPDGNLDQDTQARTVNHVLYGIQGLIKDAHELGTDSCSFTTTAFGLVYKFACGPDYLTVTDKDGSLIYSGGSAGWMNDADRVREEALKAAHAYLRAITPQK